MLIYATSKCFPRKTFVLTAKPKHTIARVRAQLLHLLYEFGREDHQFRLRFDGKELKDSLTLDDYHIMNNAVFKMIPMSKDNDSLFDLDSLPSDFTEDISENTGGVYGSSKAALLQEINILNRRQVMTATFHGFLSMHFVGVICSLVTSHWYTFSYHLLIYILSSYYAPQYSRLGGFTGNYTIPPKVYCILFAIVMTLVAAASTTLSALKWISVIDHGCPDWLFVDECSHFNVYTAVFFGIHAIAYVSTAILLLVMLKNYHFETGDVIERLFMEPPDLKKILHSSSSPVVKERRMAAFELASMAAASDDNKFFIVASSGLHTLISLSLTEDLGTQEYAAEALAELLTVPQIQAKFVEIDGVKHLTALLHSKSERCVQEAMTAISYIAQESEELMEAIIAGRGLQDLCRAAYTSNIATQRILSGIFLQLVSSKEIRDELASMNTPAQALIQLCQLDDGETQWIALQSLELLAIESADMIKAQEELIPILLAVPQQTMESRRQTLAAKLLLYYATDPETCGKLLEESSLYDAMMLFAHTAVPTLQKVIVKIVCCMSEHPDMRIQALSVHLDQVLQRVKQNAADKEAWTMADRGLQIIQSSDDLAHLPVLSTEDKISRMQSRSDSRPGSMASLRSLTRDGDSLRGGLSGSQRSIR